MFNIIIKTQIIINIPYEKYLNGTKFGGFSSLFPQINFHAFCLIITSSFYYQISN